MDKNIMMNKFYDCISKRPQKPHSFQMSLTKYLTLIDDVKSAKIGINKQNRHYWLLRHYDVITVDGKDRLIVPQIKNQEVIYYVILEELFDILFETHTSLRHGGRDKMRNELNQHYKNITFLDIQTFLNLCEPCVEKRKCDRTDQTISSNLTSRCQVELIDLQSQADGEFKFVMVYQDYLTKFLILRALKSKETVEIADQLLDIFLLFGAHSIIQSSNGEEFTNKIIEDLKIMWPGLKIICGKDQNRVGHTNKDIENILNSWMIQERCNNWRKGLGFVQFMKNRAFHTGLKRSPYEAMFGQPAKVGLASSSLHQDVIQDIFTEEDLEKVLQGSSFEKSLQDQTHENSLIGNVIKHESGDYEHNLFEDSFKVSDGEQIEDKVGGVKEQDADICKKCRAPNTSLKNSDVCEQCSIQIKPKRMKLTSDTSHAIKMENLTEPKSISY